MFETRFSKVHLGLRLCLYTKTTSLLHKKIGLPYKLVALAGSDILLRYPEY